MVGGSGGWWLFERGQGNETVSVHPEIMMMMLLSENEWALSRQSACPHVVLFSQKDLSSFLTSDASKQ